jgi:hypothetical protein
MGPSVFKDELVRIARAENQAFGGLERGNPRLEDRIECYRRRVEVPLGQSVNAHYSAVFISWCMRTAGASKEEFPAVVAHWQYAEWAAANAENGSGLFWARRVENYAPVQGDLIHFNRDGGRIDYDWILWGRGGYTGESGIVVGFDNGTAVVVMGNKEPEGNIGLDKVPLTHSGLVLQRNRNPFIAVIEVGK